MEREEIKERLIKVMLQENIGIENVQDIGEGESLEAFGMDSFIFVQMVVNLEQEFKIEVPNEYLLFERWGTIDKIICTIDELLI